MPAPFSRPLEFIIRCEGRQLARCLVRPGRYVIGHDRLNEVSLDDPSVSAKHAVLLIVSEEEMYLEDLHSANGTFVDGQPCDHPLPVALDSLVQIGSSSLLFQRGGLPAAVFREAPHDLLSPARYEWGEPMVRGGISVIHEARDPSLGRPLALRVMQPASQFSAPTVLRFVREAQIMGQLQHPNIPPVHELRLDEDGQLYYATRAIEGETLGTVLDRLRARDADEAARWPLPSLLIAFQKAADGVAYAHSRGVIHASLRPENILVGDFGEVLVTGWTFARLFTEGLEGVGEERQVRAAGEAIVAGLTPYSAPEQAAATGVFDERVDVYALGAILYALLTHGAPIPDLGESALAERILAGEIPAPRQAEAAEPGRAGLAQIIMKALSNSPERRQSSVIELQAELAAVQEGKGEAKKSGWRDLLGR